MSELKTVPVDILLTAPHDDFIDCGEIGCEANGVRLNTRFSGSRYFNCLACRNFLSHEPGRGWELTVNTREDILRKRDEARDKHTPQVGAVWQTLRKMRRAA